MLLWAAAAQWMPLGYACRTCSAACTFATIVILQKIAGGDWRRHAF
jgi:hypothetical protein